MGVGGKSKVKAAKAAPKRKQLHKVGGCNNSTYAGQTYLIPGIKSPHCPYSKKDNAQVVGHAFQTNALARDKDFYN